MQAVGIQDGDILVVDKSVEAADGKVVVAIVYNEFRVKTLKIRDGKTPLAHANKAFKEIKVTPEMDCEAWGVVTSVIRKLR